MEDISLIRKLSILMNIIASSPLFLFCFMVGISVLIFYIVNIKKSGNVNKFVFIAIWLCLALMLIINYNTTLFGILDNLFDAIFTALFFPNLTVYIIILLIINFTFFYSVFSKKIDQPNKVLNIIITLITNIFLLMIIDIVNSHNINVYEELTVYSNSTLLVLLELTMSVFVSWILVSLLLIAHKKLKRYDKKEYPEMPEIVFDDV